MNICEYCMSDKILVFLQGVDVQYKEELDSNDGEGEKSPVTSFRCSDSGRVIEKKIILEVHWRNGSKATIRRTFHHLHRWHAKLRRLRRDHKGPDDFPLFPSKKLKKLLSSSFDSWSKCDENWQKERTKSLDMMDSYFSRLCSVSLDEDYQRQVERFVKESLFVEELQQWTVQKEDELRSRGLQQYFMSQHNVELIVRLVGNEKICPISKKQKVESCGRIQNNSLNYGHMLIIEPSCGDGRVLLALAESYPDSCVIGNDVDCLMVEKSKTMLHAHGLLGSPVRDIYCSDFLSLTRNMIADEHHSWPEVIVVGNPPFTLGGGTGALSSQGNGQNSRYVNVNSDKWVAIDDGRDLPLKFLVHACAVLMATRVIFLLPKRCSADNSFISDAKKELCRISPHMNCDWNVQTFDESDGVHQEFDFCSRKVRQSVVLQIWSRC